MTMTPDDLREFLIALCGADEHTLLLVRDMTSEMGWRPWTIEDGRVFCDWVSARVDEDRRRGRNLACYKIKDVAAHIGVSVPKLQSWLRRRENPIPHVKDGRLTLIPEFLMMEWLREESERNRESRF